MKKSTLLALLATSAEAANEEKVCNYASPGWSAMEVSQGITTMDECNAAAEEAADPAKDFCVNMSFGNSSGEWYLC